MSRGDFDDPESLASAWTFLRNGLYSEYRIPEAQGAGASGVLRHNLGDGRTAFVARDDCAAAAAAVLAGGDEHSGQAYDITGPELLGATDLAQLYAELITSFGRAIRKGWLEALRTAVQDLTGRAPASLRSVLEPALAGAH